MSEEKFECFAHKYGVDALEQKEKEGVEKYGWYAHAVPGDFKNSPTGMNIHTHHIQESFNHPDLQIVISVSPSQFGVMMSILHNAVNNFIKKGEKFEVGKEYKNIVGNGYSVTFAKTKECGREVLRMILPDKNGYIQKNEPMSGGYELQYEGTHE